MAEGDNLTDTPEFQAALAAAVETAITEKTGGLGIDGLKKNHDKLLREKKAAEEAAAEAEAEKAAKLADAARKAGDAEKLEKQLTEQHTKEVTKLSAEVTALRGNLEDVLVDREALTVLTKHSSAPGLLLPHIKSQVRVQEIDGQYRAVVVDPAGTPRLKEGAKTTEDRMTIEDLVMSMKGNDEFKAAFPSSGGSGSASQSSVTSGAGGTRTVDGSDPNAFIDNLDAIAEGTVKVISAEV